MKTLYESILDIDDVVSGVDEIELIKQWCDENVKGDYKIDPKTYDINSNGNIIITNKDITEIPDYIHFGHVDGNFECSRLITSLKGVPKEIGRNFDCIKCTSLKSLEGAPKKVGGMFYCIECSSLTSLKGAPEKVGGDFICSNCTSLTSLEGAPKKVGWNFDCSGCKSLTSLEGTPENVGGSFYCYDCKSLKSLKGAPKKVGGDFYCSGCAGKFIKNNIKNICKVKGLIYV